MTRNYAPYDVRRNSDPNDSKRSNTCFRADPPLRRFAHVSSQDLTR